MNDGEKQRLNESREELKTIKDAIRYQKLLLSAESKLKTRKIDQGKDCKIPKSEKRIRNKNKSKS